MLIEALGMQFSQIAILRYGALGVVFQFVFIAATSLLLFFDRRWLFCLLQLLFFVLNAGLTTLTIWWGVDSYGIGFFLAALLASIAGWLLLTATFRDLNYLTFVGNNPSVRAAVQSRASRPGRGEAPPSVQSPAR